jgi:putative transposase
MTRYRIVQEHALYFVTFSVAEWLPIFIDEESCRIVTDSFNFCHEHKCLRTNAYVIMPTHLHAIVFDADFEGERLNRTLADLRKYTGQQLTGFCLAHMPSCFGTTLRRAAGEDRKHRLWQGGTHPEAIYTQHFWREKVDYIHANPIQKGLVTEAHHWRYSSAAYWLEGGESDVVLSAVDW